MSAGVALESVPFALRKHRMSKRLLIVIDQEPVTTRALELDLRDAGYHVETACDGEEAIEKLGSSRFDLLIAAEPERLDLSRSFLAAFRRVQPAAKVVWMTTHDQPHERLQRGRWGARVKKPFDLEEFRSVVGELLM
jgi:DNA-binding response OmpR family regulator